MSTENISDTFVKGRYGHLTDFIPDNESLIKLIHAIRKTVQEHSNAITISTGFGFFLDDNCSDYRMIFPDINSKIYILDNQEDISRVFRFMKYSEYIENIAKRNLIQKFGNELLQYDDVKPTRDKKEKYVCCPEYGIQKMLSISEKHNTNVNNDKIPYCENILAFNSNENSTIVIQSGGETISYMLINGEFFQTNNEINEKLKNIINSYEKNINESLICNEIKNTENFYNPINEEQLNLHY